MLLGPLYHWSPADRREQILRDGLQPYAPPAVSGGGEMSTIAWPYLCFGLTAKGAWRYSGDMGYDHLSETEWDLWQVALADTDEVHIRAEFGPRVKEVRVHNAIPADRVWWVARRDGLVARCPHGGETHTECSACFPSL
jgi:hypothetical protein